MSSVRQVAKVAGVSIGTVSRVLNNHPQVSIESRAKVMDAMKRSGYDTSTRRHVESSVIAMVATGGPASLNSPFDIAIFDGISQGIQDHAYDLMVIDAQRARRANETFVQMLQRKGIRGALLRTTSSTRRVCEEICREGFPAVVIADHFDDPQIASCSVSSDLACRKAVEHLLHLGHRRIAITLNIIDDHDHALRFEAYKQALAAAGLPVEDRLVMRVPAHRDAGAVALRQIMGMPDRPSAVFCTDPLAAVGLMHEALRMGVSIPKDLSVVGFDDTDARFGVYPRMSSVCQDAAMMGREAFAMLQRIISGRTQSPLPPSTLDCWLELHDTTAAPFTAG